MKRFVKGLAAVLCAALLVALPVTGALAQDANVTYSGNAGDFIFKPGSRYSLTDLFPNFKDVMPGDSLTQRITVKNNADKKVKVKIYMRSIGAIDAESKEFLDQLMLTVKRADETNPMFLAEADKTAGLRDWRCLGLLYSGGTVDLDITLDVPVTLDNMFQQKIGALRWQFKLEEIPIDDARHRYCSNCGAEMYRHTCRDANGQLYEWWECDHCGFATDPSPKTGDDSPVALWCVVAGGCVTVFVLLLVLRRKKEQSAEEGHDEP